jgi:dTDP-4-dehydrorhamnose reductase
MKKTIILGASGQLGNCIAKVAGERGLTNVLFPSEQNANILSIDQLRILFESEQPAFVVNCAAYTAVDKAEDDVEKARLINKVGPQNIAQLCQEFNCTLIHISTDFVFAGNQTKLLNEQDIAEPVSVYGLTKLEGELAIAETLPQHIIIRTAWLYSEFGNNFVKTMQRLGRERDELGVIVDQIGTPTYGVDLAGIILDFINQDGVEYGTYHYSNEGAVSWYDFAQTIFEESNIVVRVKPLRTDEYPTRAMRPSWSVMDKSKIRQTLGTAIPYWKESLKKCIAAIG